ncbi:hypothetical protein F4809DRAFT_622812 [Biscogniauxia mediterranea]|nr:hypothetical protein F4809DRAFT_622812 [Biscogniauxia mediterranea]
MPPRSAAEPEAQWPPRSPHEALLSTPGGRERLRRLADRASPSPSPTKRGRITPGLATRYTNHRQANVEDDNGMDLDEEEDDDEEMLQLKLAAIQAKLKLKKLQSAKTRKGLDIETSSRPGSSSMSDLLAERRAHSRADSSRPGSSFLRPQSQTEIQVPASPVRRAQTAQDNTSPSRVRLGIDKGLRAKDVSLKRAPVLKKPEETQNGSQGGYLRRAYTPTPTASAQRDRPKSFNERLAAARTEEADRIKRQERIRKARSTAFELGKQEMEQFKDRATELPPTPMEVEEFSREEIMAGGNIKRSSTLPTLRRPSQDEHRSSSRMSGNESQMSDRRIPPSEVPEEEAAGFEPYSSIHLSKRIIPHPVLTRNLAGKKTYGIKDLLKHVKAPDFQLPEVEQDIVVFGILASKSEPRAHKPTPSDLREKTNSDPSRGKYMVLKLVDLQWELELFLFNTGFERYWKLTPGTLLAVLNPSVMPPPPGRTDTGRFGLVINSGEDTILEVGGARDLGFCKSIKKDGEPCNSWVNRKRTEFCEFHMNHALSRHRQARQDINAFNMGLGPGSSSGDKKYKNSNRLNSWESYANDPKKRTRGNFDRETQSQLFISKPSAASMIDNEVLGGHVGDRIERGEALRRRLATEEKERELMKKLGKLGNGAGRDYMISGQQKASTARNKFGSSVLSSGTAATTATGQTDEPKQQYDAKSLGLIAEKGKGPKIHLSPIKRKRVNSAISNTSSSFDSTFTSSRTTLDSNPKPTSRAPSAFGWGGGLKEKLARMRDGEKLRNGYGSNNPSSSFDSALAGGSSFDDATNTTMTTVTTTSTAMPTSSSFKSTTSQDSNMRGDKPPARKKTRFVTEKGIREAGRESLGGPELSGRAKGDLRGEGHRGGMVVLDDDEDDLLMLD